MIKEKFQKLKGKASSQNDAAKVQHLAFILCETFGWDYYTLQKQPLPFVLSMIDELYKKSEKEKKMSK